MNLTKFVKFCAKRQATQTVREAFYHFLTDKYPEGIPADVNLSLEWSAFYIEATSKTGEF